MAKHPLSWLVVVGLCVTPALAQPFNSGSDGSDGHLLVPADTELIIDLGDALTGPWDTPIPLEDQGKGIYDPDKWAVVFKYSTIDIEAGATVRFINHPKNPPVVWLASGDVGIAGLVNIPGGCGEDCLSDPPMFTEPGPGGFEGGRRGFNSTNLDSSWGMGPGGGGTSGGCGAGGGYRVPGSNTGCSNAPEGETYGNEFISPLIGGSGGGAGFGNVNAGSGGGALIIAASGEILMVEDGMIFARGGSGLGSPSSRGGSGGAIRLIANKISGPGELNASGGFGGGGSGRIRVEAPEPDLNINLEDAGNPNWTSSVPGPVFPPLDAPTLKATLVDGEQVPPDPDAGIKTTDLEIDNVDDVEVRIEATNIPLGTTVTVMAIPARGDREEFPSNPNGLQGSFESSSTSAMVSIPPGRVEIQLRANWTP